MPSVSPGVCVLRLGLFAVGTRKIFVCLFCEGDLIWELFSNTGFLRHFKHRPTSLRTAFQLCLSFKSPSLERGSPQKEPGHNGQAQGSVLLQVTSKRSLFRASIYLCHFKRLLFWRSPVIPQTKQHFTSNLLVSRQPPPQAAAPPQAAFPLHRSPIRSCYVLHWIFCLDLLVKFLSCLTWKYSSISVTSLGTTSLHPLLSPQVTSYILMAFSVSYNPHASCWT